MPDQPAATAKDYRASDDPNWQPWTKNDGTVVTLTPDHCDAIYQALLVYKRVAKPPVFDVDAAIGILGFLRAKSCLMGRLLYDGKPPLVDAPPLVMAAPDYSLEVPRAAPPDELPWSCCSHCRCPDGRRSGHDDLCRHGCNEAQEMAYLAGKP